MDLTHHGTGRRSFAMTTSFRSFKKNKLTRSWPFRLVCSVFFPQQCVVVVFFCVQSDLAFPKSLSGGEFYIHHFVPDDSGGGGGKSARHDNNGPSKCSISVITDVWSRRLHQQQKDNNAFNNRRLLRTPLNALEHNC